MKQVKVNKKKNKTASSDGGGGTGRFPAINLLHDPQAAAEKVFRRLRQSKQRFEVIRSRFPAFRVLFRLPFGGVGRARTIGACGVR